MYVNNTSYNRFRGNSTEHINNFVAKKPGKKRSTANEMLEHSTLNDHSGRICDEDTTNYRGNILGNRYPRFVHAPNSLLPCNSEVDTIVKKTLQRQNEERIMEVPMSIIAKFNPDTVLAVGDATACNLTTSVLLSNKPRQNGSHHKPKCRGRKAFSQFKGTPAIAPGTAAANATKQVAVLPNTALSGQISTTTACAVEITSKQTSRNALAAISMTSLVEPTFAQPLLAVPIFSQAWQQFLYILRNFLGETAASFRLSKERVNITQAVTRKTTKIVQSTTSAATLVATEASAATAHSKTGAAAISPAHLSGRSSSRTKFRLLPSLGATSFLTVMTLICLETVLLSTVSNCAKTFYMHWNTSNSIFRIDNTDHIIDVNKGNLAFEFDQVHIICPVYEPGTFENETEKYIIYNVSKVEYETCRITNADPRVIAICDKPQKLMFFTITFRPFTPQPGGLEFLPGNDYYFISTSSKDDLYRRIGGRCSTNNMKVVFKVCCSPDEKNKTSSIAGSGTSSGGSKSAVGINSADGNGMTTDPDNLANVNVINSQSNINQHQHMNNINTIGINGVNTGLMPIGGVNIGVSSGVGVNNGGIQMKPINGAGGTSINTNIDHFNRIPIQAGGINAMANNIGGLGGIGLGGHGGGGIMLTPGGHGGINMISSGGGIGIGQYPGHPGQTGIRINNVASQQHHATHKNNNNNGDPYEKHPNEVVKNEELTYNSGAASTQPWPVLQGIGTALSWPVVNLFGWLLSRGDASTLMTSTTAMLLGNNCHKNQRYLSSHFECAAYRRKRESETCLPSFVKSKYLNFSYKKLICSIAILAVTINILKFRALGTKLSRTATTVVYSSSLAKTAIVPIFLIDTFNQNVNQKLTLIELKSAFVNPIAYESLGLTSLSTQGYTSASISSTSSSTQYFAAVWNTDNTTSNTILLNRPFIKYCRRQIYSVSVKVKRFR